MAKTPVRCPFNDKLCIECTLYRGRHYYLCNCEHYRGYIKPKNTVITDGKLESVGFEKIKGLLEPWSEMSDKILVSEPADMLSKININKVSYLVIACRGHLEDQRTLIEALKTNAFYIGLLGSKKKVKTVFSNMVKEGVLEESLKRIHAPIGVPIATDTPEEIAISIMAEIIDVRRQKKNKKVTIC